MYRIDLHCHSYGSHDGGLLASDIRAMLASNKLNTIAITDHDHIEAARKLKAEFAEQIIIGEEITTSQGEIIGLFLKYKIKPMQSIYETINEIKSQGGLVYLPHPFDIIRPF